MVVVLKCSTGVNAAKEEMWGTRKVCLKFGVTVHVQNCVETCVRRSCFDFEARETGMILRWILSNYEALRIGTIERVVFNHAHESSWHQSNFTRQLERLFEASQFFFGNDYGDVFPYYIDHRVSVTNTGGGRAVHVFYRHFDILGVLQYLTQGTRFEYFNRTNRFGVWRSGQATSFFVSRRALLRYSPHDYAILLRRTRSLIRSRGFDWNYYVAEVTERSWQVLLTNKTWVSYRFEPPPSFGRTRVYAFTNSSPASLTRAYCDCPECLLDFRSLRSVSRTEWDLDLL